MTGPQRPDPQVPFPSDSPPADHPIVVGVDGSADSVRALIWAMGQSRVTGVRLEAVIAWQDQVVYGVTYPWAAGASADTLETIAGKALAAAVAQAGADLTARPGASAGQPVPVLTRVVNGDPAQVLLDAAATANLMVVGSRGHGAIEDVLLGSVSQRLCQRSPCPVVVVPRPHH